MRPSLSRLATLVKQVAAAETSADPAHWDPENPLWGHCAITTLLVQDFFGGTLRRIDLSSLPKLSHLRSHYVNILDTGESVDLTSEQFFEPLPKSLPYEERVRERLLSHHDTVHRYGLLKIRVGALLKNTP